MSASTFNLTTSDQTISTAHTKKFVNDPSILEDLTFDKSIPSFVLALIDPNFAYWDSVGISIGSNIEVDINSLETISPGLGLRALSYWERCYDFWDKYAAGLVAGHAIRVDRQLSYARQSDTKNGRVDLTSQLNALSELPLLGPLVSELTGASPSLGDMSQRFLPLIVTIATTGDESVVLAEFPARQDFPNILGGPHSRGEVSRRFRITVNHAKWRDRRVRRLVAVEVEAIEIWPDPASF